MLETRDKLGRRLRDLRISVTDQCNFRCAYCMPKEIFGPNYKFLERASLLSNAEIVSLAKAFARLGVKKIRLTGGEPLMRRDLADLALALKAETGVEDLSLTTNGVLLPRYAADLKRSGIDRINVSLDSLDEERFAKISGDRGKPSSVLAGIEAAQSAGLPLKVNMVVQRGVNEIDILPMADFFRDRKITLRFIEYMDVGNTNQWKLDQVVPAKEIVRMISERYPLEPVQANYVGEVAKRYRYLDTGGEIGLITSVSNSFCGDCNRARISADGKLFTCLFASAGTDLRALIRSGADGDAVYEFISKIWGQRDDRYSELRAQISKTGEERKRIEMSYIGG